MANFASDWVVLFGTPGVGKSTIAKAMEAHGYHYYEADEDLLPEVVALNKNNQGLTPELRDRQHEVIFDRVVEFTKKYRKFVMAYDFMWERYRRRLSELCPDLRWVYLVVDRDTLRKRVDRPGHVLTPEFAMYISERFERPEFPIEQVVNIGKIDEVVSKIVRP